MGFCLVLVVFFCVPDIQGKESVLRNHNFVLSVIYFITFLLTKTLEFVITELEHETEVHSDIITLFARLEQDTLANTNIYVPKNPLGGIHPNCCC